jgi:hypothetical protein
MATGTLFARVWRYLSIIGAVIALITSYIAYPGDVAIRFDASGLATAYVNREVLFYGVVAIFLVNNVLLNSLVKLIPRVPSGVLPVPNPAVWAAHRRQLNQHLTNWLWLLMAAINTVLGLWLFVLSLVNKLNGVNDDTNFAWLLPLATAIFALVIVALPVRLLLKPARDDD